MIGAALGLKVELVMPKNVTEPRKRVALAYGAPAEPIQRFLTELQGAHLEITGDDLIAAGVPEGPLIGQALNEVLRMKLDGRVSGRGEELRTALELVEGGQ